jgi:quercetin dioxygenase-like cupin family protein
MPRPIFRLAAAALCLGAASGPARAGGDQVKMIAEQALANVPGKTLTVIEVDYAPGGKSLSHRHAGSATIFAYVIEGSIRSQLEGQPVHVYHAGESWSEPPGAHHLVSENASTTAPARLLAVFVADTGAKLTTYDRR